MLMIAGKTPDAVKAEVLKWLEWHRDCEMRNTTVTKGSKSDRNKSRYAAATINILIAELSSAVIAPE